MIEEIDRNPSWKIWNSNDVTQGKSEWLKQEGWLWILSVRFKEFGISAKAREPDLNSRV